MDPNTAKFNNTDMYKNKKKRRPRSAAGERNYMCGCGKAYLSYPALYTHVKNKHDGIFPIGSNAKRKIPKNVEEDCDHLFVPNLNRFFTDFEDFVGQIDNAASDDKKFMTEFDIDRLFEPLDTSSDKEAQLFKAAIKSALQLGPDPNKFEKIKDSVTINQILGYYLVCIFSYCNFEFFKEYFCLVFMIVKALNDKGDMFIDKTEKIKQPIKKDDKLFTDTTDVYVTTEILNLFIAELFPNYLKFMKEERKIEFKYLGFEDEHIKNLILMCKYLANWLFNNEFIEYRLEINVDF